MTLACESCGGTGYGRIDRDPEYPEESRGFVGSTKPCPACVVRFEESQKKAKVKITYGPAPASRKRERKSTVQFIDSAPHESGESFDPGVVNTGTEVVTIDDALAQTASEEE